MPGSVGLYHFEFLWVFLYYSSIGRDDHPVGLSGYHSSIRANIPGDLGHRGYVL